MRPNLLTGVDSATSSVGPVLLIVACFVSTTVCISLQPAPKTQHADGAVSQASADGSDPEDWLNSLRENRFMHKRGPDPKSLFANIYGNYDQNIGKRAPKDPRQLFASIYDNYGSNIGKRGSDPRNLFSSIYDNYDQNIGKRASDPRNLFASIYGNYGDNIGKRTRTNRSPVYGSLQAFNDKRGGLYGRSDPRNLYRAIYGYRRR